MAKSKTRTTSSKTAARREAEKVANWKRSDGIKAPLVTAKVLSSQDPHAVSEARDNILEVAIGREVRNFRNKLGIKISDLADAADISVGMLSKIENGMTSPSLTTLQALARALSVPVTSFFRRYEERRSVSFVKAGEGLAIERRG